MKIAKETGMVGYASLTHPTALMLKKYELGVVFGRILGLNNL